MECIRSVKMAVEKKRDQTVTLKIPADLYANIEKLIANTGFRSVTEFSVFVLRDVASGGALKQNDHGLSRTEIDAVRKRLKALGYFE